MSTTSPSTIHSRHPIASVVSLFARGAQYAYTLLLQPRSSVEDDKRRERIFTIVLFCMNVFFVILVCSAILQKIRFGNAYTGINLFFFSGVVLCCLYLYYISRVGYFKIASYLFISIYFLLTFYGSIHFGVSMPAGLLSYVLVIIMTSIVISSRLGMIATGISIAAISATGFIEHLHTTLPSWRLLPIQENDIVQYSVFFLLIAAISWLSNSEMERSLRRARTSERLLKEERDNLEVLVEARTRALRAAEADRVAQLYRFADFGKRSAGLFHDLLGPLGALTLTVGSLHQKADAPATDDTALAITRAIDATRRMEGFMNTIKNQLTETESIGSFSPLQQAEEALHLLHYQATHAQVTISLSGIDTLVFSGSAFKYRQLITNLVANAIESYEGSTATEKEVSVSIAATPDGHCLTTVTDHGTGIAPETMTHIFDTFFTTKASGIGLGLATVKDIVEKTFHGTIECTSSRDHGTSFIISLPLSHDDNGHTHLTPEHPAC